MLETGSVVAGPDILLAIRGLRTHFDSREGVIRAVEGIDLTVRRGRTVGLVGESGCGKSVTALSVMRLVPPPGRIVEGTIELNGIDLTALSEREMYGIRGNRVAMIFQEPMSSLNPMFKVGDQIAEAALVHQKVSRAGVRQRVLEMLSLVGIAQPELRYSNYPHELSGGMRQRVMIAMALVCHPELLIADEPTTSLDVTIQAQILDLIKDVTKRANMAVLLITHDLGVIAEMAEDVSVMYAGKIVEIAGVIDLFKRPRHPYTQGLLASIPTLSTPRDRRLSVIGGNVPHMLGLDPGCHFAPRCPHAMPVCQVCEPDLSGNGSHRVACWLYRESEPDGDTDVGN